jgi:hypothetical protein
LSTIASTAAWIWQLQHKHNHWSFDGGILV